MSEVCAEWRLVHLKDTGIWLSGGTPFTDDPRYWDGDIPWISAASLKGFHINQSDRCVTKLGALSGTRLVPRGTVLFVVRGMSLKTEFRVGVTERQVAFGQDCKAIIPTLGIDPKFLALSLKANSRQILAMVDEAGHGTGRLPTDLISKLTVGIPGLPEQGRITEILDSVDDLIHYSERLIQKELALRKAIIASLLAVQKVNATMIDVLEESPKNGLYRPWSDYGDDGIPIIRIDSIRDGEVDAIETLRRVRISASEERMFDIQPDDILINRVNTVALVGKSAIVRDITESTVFESNIMRCRINESIARAHYIALWLGTAMAMSHFRKSAKSAVAQASINQRDVASCPVALPSLSDQEALIKRFESIRMAITLHKSKLSQLRSLKQGLMDDLLVRRARIPAQMTL